MLLKNKIKEIDDVKYSLISKENDSTTDEIVSTTTISGQEITESPELTGLSKYIRVICLWC